VTETGAALVAISSASARGGHQLVGGIDCLDQPRVERFIGADLAAGVAPFERGLDADEARQEPARSTLGQHPAPGEYEIERSSFAGETNVHGQRQGSAQPCARPVDRADDGFAEAEDPLDEIARSLDQRGVIVIDRPIGPQRGIGACLGEAVAAA
jgi:hypothetical protein